MQTSVRVVPEIRRENLEQTLENMLDGETQAVVVEGQEGLGKSTLLGQFLQRTEGRSFGVSVSGASRWMYDPPLVLNRLACEMSLALRGRELEAREEPEDRVFGRFLTQLDRRAQKEARPCYIVLDGLEEIPATEEAAITQILGLLPYGYRGFRFLMSGDLNTLPLSPSQRRVTKSWRIVYFTRDEAAKYLEGLGLSPEALGEIYDATQGVPGYLASVRRRLESTSSVQSVLENLPDVMHDSFALEWQATQGLGPNCRLALAALAHESGVMSVETLSDISGADSDTIRSSLGSLSFLRVTTEDTVEFVSESFRKFAAKHLSGLRQAVMDIRVDKLAQTPDSDEAVKNLPELYAVSGRAEKLIEYLSPERFARLFLRTTSLSTVTRHAEDALQAARDLGRQGDVVRFMLQLCAVRDLARGTTSVSEVRAMSALGDYDGALAAANGVQRLEMRLRLLAAIASVRKQRGLPIDQALKVQVQSVYRQVDPKALGDALPELASDLFAVSPELATQLVREMTDDYGENAMDWALAKLSVQALITEKSPEAREAARLITGRITDPAAKQLSIAATALVGGLSAREVIAESTAHQSTSEKLFLLQRWMWSNRQRADAVDVLEHGIRLAITATGYTANAGVMRQLALCLPYIASEHTLWYYVKHLDAQRADLERLGPADDFVRLQLILARAVWRTDQGIARQRFLDLYNTIDGLRDPAVRVPAFARLAAALRACDPDCSLDASDDLHKLAKTELEEGYRKLLNATADHIEACRGVIKALAFRCPAEALDLVTQLNTESCRDRGYLEFVRAALDGPVAEIPRDALAASLGLIVDHRVSDRARRVIVDELDGRNLDLQARRAVAPLLEQALHVRDTEIRLLVAARSLTVIGPDFGKDEGLAGLRARLESTIREAWATLADDWQKHELGLQLVVELAKESPLLAAEYVKEVNSLKERITPGGAEAGETAFYALRLAVRAMGGLIGARGYTPSDQERLATAINRLGSLNSCLRLYAELALRYYLAGRSDECSVVVQQQMLPRLDAMRDNQSEFERLLVELAPALFVGAAAIADTLVARLPPRLRDDALDAAATFLIRKAVPWDPFERVPGGATDLSYEEAGRVMQLMRSIGNDSFIYFLMKNLVDSILAGGNLKAAQKLAVAQQLTELSEDKFPNSRFIKHDGYVIAATAQIQRLTESRTRNVGALRERAKTLPNTADRAYVLTVVAGVAAGAKERRDCVNEARRLADEIPTLADKLDHYQHISSELARVDASLSRTLLQDAIKMALGSEGESVAQRRRSLIDLASRLHPDIDIADSLASLADDDPVKQRIDEQLRLRRMKEALAHRGRTDLPVARQVLDWSRAAWLRLGSLVAKRGTPTSPERALPMLQFAQNQSLANSFPIFAWFIENALQFRRDSAQTRAYVRSLFEACLLGAEVALHALNRPTHAGRLLAIQTGSDSFGTIVGAGERERGLGYVRRWLEEQVCGDSIVVIERYFKPAAVELLALIADSCPDSDVTVIAGRQESLEGLSTVPEDAYRAEWRRLRSDEPPLCRLLFLQTRVSAKFPFHDRWWLTERAGLCLGTSFAGLGVRISEVRPLDTGEAEQRWVEVMPYLTLTKREFDGERIDYTVCTL